MDHPIITALLLAAGLTLAMVAQRRRWRPSLRIALAVGIGFRVVLLALAAADSYQPVDFTDSFKPAGEAVLDGEDPVLSTDGAWHFLPMIPYLYALGLGAGLPWEIAGRLVTVVADVVLIVLVGKLAGGRQEALRRFQYACNPLALMVSVIHAQVEPVALVFLVGAYLAARSGRPVAAGALFGLALSAKSWPIILLPVLLVILPGWRELRAYVQETIAVSRKARTYLMLPVRLALLRGGRDIIKMGIAVVAVPILFLATLPFTVGTSFSEIVNVTDYVGGVRPIVGEWGWTALLTGGNWELNSTYSRVGQLVLYATLLAVAWLWRRADRVDLTTAMLLAFMIVTPRMGTQYLLWFVPFLVARPTRWAWPAMTVASVWAGVGYIFLTQFDVNTWWNYHTYWAMSSVLVIPWLALAMPWNRRRSQRQPVPAQAPATELATIGLTVPAPDARSSQTTR